MKTKKLLLFVSLLFLFSFQKASEKLDFEFADTFCASIEKQVGLIGKQYGLKNKELIPVIYPECARFSKVSNVFESDLLSYYYAQNGCQGADFSVGYFQMKPSFLEGIEKIVATDSNFISFREKFNYKTVDLKAIRMQRLDRLFSQTWQIEYLCAFVKYCKQKYALEKTTLSELKFTAAAYNYGFNKPTAEIISWAAKKAFPNGIKSQETNFSYSELAHNYQLKKYGHE